MTTKPSATRPKRPQRQRVALANLPPFLLTPRDGEILHSLYTYRALTTNHISDLHFAPLELLKTPSPSSRCLHRLKLLYHAQFITRSEQPHLLAAGRKPFVYQLDRRGADWLALQQNCEVTDLDWRAHETLSPLFLDHLLTTNEVRIAIVRAAQRRAYTLEQWLDDKTLKQRQNKESVVLTGANGKRQAAALVPDGFFVLHTGSHYYHCFLEVDRATTTGISGEWGRRTFARKIAVYLEYYNSGKYHARYHTKSMRVLTVTLGEKRLDNLLKVTQEVGGKGRFWFTTLERMQPCDPLHDEIWQLAGRPGMRSLIW